jgi:cytochrome c-type biogenesis protein
MAACCVWLLGSLSLSLLLGLHQLPGAQAQPALSWDPAQEPQTTAVSEPQLRVWEEAILHQDAADTAQLAQHLAIGVRQQDSSIIQPVLERLTSLPEPKTLSARLIQVELYQLAFLARPEPAYLQRLSREGRALQADWLARRTAHQVVQAREAAAIARQLFQIGRLLPQQPFTEQAMEILSFLERHLISPVGALQRFDPIRGSAVRDGQLIDNASLGLAFFAGYSSTDNGYYLDVSRRLAELIRIRLQDRALGGFYARNAVNPRNNMATDIDAPDELFDDRKPILGNALAILLLERVGETFAEARLRNAAGRALAVWLEQEARGGSSAANFALLQAAQAWVAPTEHIADKGLEGISFGLLLPLAFMAGVLSFLSPCTLPILPAYFAVAFQSDRRRLLWMTLAFFLGLAFSFSMLGATASYLGALLVSYQSYLLQGAGIIIILFGLATLVGKGFAGVRFQGRPATTLSGSFLFGLSFAIGWTACIGPILGAILVLAASQQQVLSGAVLLFVFAMGLGLPLIGLSLAFDHLDRSGRVWRWLRGKGWSLQWAGRRFQVHSSGLLSGLLLITLGLLMLGCYLSYLNRILPFELQAWFAGVEQNLVQALRR